MPFLSTAFMTASKPILFVPILVFLLVILFHDSVVDADFTTTNIGAIINVNSRIGKEQNIAMKIAVQNFNNKSSLNHKLSLNFHNLSGDSLQAAYAARELIKEKHVQAIVGTDTWAEAALVANIGSQAQVPLISFASSTIKTRQQPFLIQMVTDISEQLNCVASIVHSLTWRKVIVVYEEDISGGDFGMLALLSDELQNVGSDIEYHLVFPPFSSLSDPKKFVHEELKKLNSTQSRAFIVLQSSFSLTTLLFQEAKKMRLMGKDSAWVITDTIASFLDSANSSILSSMEGVLGIKKNYSDNTKSFRDFYDQFRVSFGSEYPEEENYNPGIHALRAYDSIQTIARAMERSLITNTSTTTSLLKNILSSNFNGLSGEIHFEEGRLLSYRPIYQLINVVNIAYNNLGFWSTEFGFSKSPKFEDKNCERGDFMKLLDRLMSWPGNSNQVPKGWKMPTLEEPLRIGVPGMAAFDNFVRRNSSNKTDGFCISVFEEVHRILEETYYLPYEFVEFNGTYDDLVANVANKTFDAAVGDITILAKRWKGVEFTQPFTESGLSMVVPSKPSHKAWIFLEPFTWGMWLATGAILIYTMFIVWFLEHRSNPEFSGAWKDQLGNALWFTCSSLFLAHREKIQSNYTRAVVVVWLFVALVLTQSYTASLTSMLTISRLQPNFEYMKMSNATVGCDNNTFMRQYAEDVLGYNSDNVKNISNQQKYLMAFKNGIISAALLEIPYAKVFVNNHCGEYTITGSSYRFGGFGFVFQKGSPIAADVSEAILKLSENGKLKVLEVKWLTPLSSDCSDSQTNQNMDSLSIESFWGLFLFSVATSSVCLVLFVVRLLKNYRLHQQSRARVGDASDESVWIKTVRLAQYLNNAETTSGGTPRGTAPISIQLAQVEETNNGNVSASRELGEVRLEVVLNHGAFLTTMEGNEAQPRLQEVETVGLDSEEINSWKGSTNDNLEEIAQDTSLATSTPSRYSSP